MSKLRVLFLCTGNACRSQMAEGWARHLKRHAIEAYSAGIETHGLNPRAVQVMAEAGVDISGHRSKQVGEFKDIAFDYVVTVCGHAHENCPFFAGNAKKIHVGFDDPPTLARDAKTEEEALAHYRRVRDEIRTFVEQLPAALQQPATPHSVKRQRSHEQIPQPSRRVAGRRKRRQGDGALAQALDGLPLEKGDARGI